MTGVEEVIAAAAETIKDVFGTLLTYLSLFSKMPGPDEQMIGRMHQNKR